MRRQKYRELESLRWTDRQQQFRQRDCMWQGATTRKRRSTQKSDNCPQPQYHKFMLLLLFGNVSWEHFQFLLNFTENTFHVFMFESFLFCKTNLKPKLKAYYFVHSYAFLDSHMETFQ